MQKVADSPIGPVLKIGRLPEALPESFITYRAFRMDTESLAKAVKFTETVAEPKVSYKSYSGHTYIIIAFRKFSPRNCTRVSRVPLECRGKAREVVKFYYDSDGKCNYVANKFALVKVS